MIEDWFERASAIPGQLTPNEMRKIHEIAGLVPENGVIVETGSLYGRSSFLWATGAKSSVEVVCVDPWERAQWIVDYVEAPLGAPKFSMDAFKQYTADCPNITPMRGYSPGVAEGWSKPIDLYFEDAVHEGPIFFANCDFWLSHLKPGGYFCGHDFRHDYYDIVKKVTSTADDWGVEFTVVNSFFFIRKPK